MKFLTQLLLYEAQVTQQYSLESEKNHKSQMQAVWNKLYIGVKRKHESRFDNFFTCFMNVIGEIFIAGYYQRTREDNEFLYIF